MKKILVTGSNGQIGAELVQYLSEIYGCGNVIATARKKIPGPVSEGGPFELLDVMEEWGFSPKYDLDTMTVDIIGRLSVK